MDSKVVSIGSVDGELNFEMADTDLSIVNSLRRVMITHIPSLVFRGFPHKSNLINIIKNNSKFNNEYLKHRIQCIPIHYSIESNFEAMVNKYDVRINVMNDTNNMRYVTTNDFIIYNKITDQPITSGEIKVKELFPPDPISGNYIPICCLMPKISESDEIEELNLTINFSIGIPKEDNCWNMVTKCCFENKRDEIAVENYLKKDKDVVEKYHKYDPVAIDAYMKSTLSPEEETDFRILDAQRFYVPNHYIMKVESVGVYSNEHIVKRGCQYLINRLNEMVIYLKDAVIEDGFYNQPNFCIYMDTTTLNPTYCFYIQNDDYTIGKIVEKYLYNMYRSNIYYVSFKKEHPHDTHCLVSFAYNAEISNEGVIDNLRSVSTELIRIYESISTKF
jgi:DNA-directed RNA polymerase alpha subunit